MSLAPAADASLLVEMKPARVAWLRFWDSIILTVCMLCALVLGLVGRSSLLLLPGWLHFRKTQYEMRPWKIPFIR